jgi:glycosyltransferase involved in cell wall biosynthesis
LTYRVPFPPTDGGAMGIYTITKGLAENGCTIDLLAINTPKHSQPKDAMKKWAHQHDVFVNTAIRPFALFKNIFFGKLPYNISRFYAEDVKRQLQVLLKANKYDFIQLEGAFVATYIPFIQELVSTPIIVRTHNIEYVIWKRLAQNERNPIKKWFFNHLSNRLYTFESQYYNLADGIAAITPTDQERLQQMHVNNTISVIPVGTEFDKFETDEVEPVADSLFIIGALDWMPNLEGLEWFMSNIWPDITEFSKHITLHIAGKNTPDYMTQWEKPNVHVHGFVDDAVHFMMTYNLMLVPLLSGGGMRVKIIEGLAAGKCIISTTVGAEGISVTHNENIILADTPEEWKNQIQRLLSHPEEIKRIGSNARTYALANFENKTVTANYIRLAQLIIDKKHS